MLGDCDFGYQYSPEIFTDTELDFALEVCEAVSDVWQPGRGPRDHPEPAGHRRAVHPERVRRPDRVVRRQPDPARAQPISLHPHNDRGTAVAATELALMAGADRIEGCLFGHGERTGNVDLVTLGMNLFTQGIDPQIDFSDIDEIRRTVEYCTQMQVHPSATRTRATWSTPPSPARTRTRSRRASRRWTSRPRPRARRSTRSPGRRRTCRSTRRTSAARTRRSSGSTRSPARAASPTS